MLFCLYNVKYEQSIVIICGSEFHLIDISHLKNYRSSYTDKIYV